MWLDVSYAWYDFLFTLSIMVSAKFILVAGIGRHWECRSFCFTFGHVRVPGLHSDRHGAPSQNPQRTLLITDSAVCSPNATVS